MQLYKINMQLYKLSTLMTLFFLITLSSCAPKKNATILNHQSQAAWVNHCKDWDDWDKPGPAFGIFGNSYYVGTCGISAILITGDDGHVLIDSGTEDGAEVVADNIESLGFSVKDIKLLLHSHEHFDHVGGLAQLQKLSGARLLASPLAAPVLQSGIAAENDPQSGLSKPFRAARVDGYVHENQPINIGNLSLTPIATPGHSPGALSWQWQSCEGDRCLSIVYADSLSPISRDDYFFSDHANYLNAYKLGLNKLASLDCQIVLAPHPSASQMRSRLASSTGLIDNQGCVNYAKAVQTRLNKRLLKEQEKREKPPAL